MSGPAMLPVDASEADRWRQWQQRYADSSRASTRQMHIVFAVAFVVALASVARALFL